MPHVRPHDRRAARCAAPTLAMPDADERRAARRRGQDDPALASRSTSGAACPAARPTAGRVPAVRRRRARRRRLRRAARLVPRRRCTSAGRRGVLRLHIYNDAQYAGVNAHIVRPACGRVQARRADRTRASVRGASSTTVELEALAVPVPAARTRHASTSGRSCWRTGSAVIVEAHPADFLRGLFHSDGCRVTNWATRLVAGAAEALRLPPLAVHQPLRRHPRAVLLAPSTSSDVPWRQSNAKTVSASPGARRWPVSTS